MMANILTSQTSIKVKIGENLDPLVQLRSVAPGEAGMLWNDRRFGV